MVASRRVVIVEADGRGDWKPLLPLRARAADIDSTVSSFIVGIILMLLWLLFERSLVHPHRHRHVRGDEDEGDRWLFWLLLARKY